MGRSPCCDKVGLKKGPWTTEEDQKLLAYIQEHGHGSWRALPPKAGLQRCGKSCRLRWTNYLRPDIKRGEFSLQEQQTIIQLHALLGNRWSAIASHLPKRTDNEIKNYWNTHLKKRLSKMGIDPTTHRPRSHGTRPKDMAHLTHMAQWEMARLEAEARIVKESNPDRRRSPTFGKPPVHTAARPPCLDILKVWRGTWQAKGKNEISFEGFYPSHHQLESPTSILNFSDNVVNNNMIHENTLFAGVNYEALGGMMGNSAMQDVPGTSSSAAICMTDNSARFPGFLESENVGFIEDSQKINYWSNILEAVGSPIDSSLVF